MFEPKHIQAVPVLRDATLRKVLLKNKSIDLEKYINFDQQCTKTQDEIVEEIDRILQTYAPFQLHYSSPVEQLPNDAMIYGTRGVYVVRNQDGCVLFTRKAGTGCGVARAPPSIWLPQRVVGDKYRGVHVLGEWPIVDVGYRAGGGLDHRRRLAGWDKKQA